MNKIIIILSIFIILIILIILFRGRSRRKGMQQRAGDKLREEALNKIILNNVRKEEITTNKAIPFEVDYSKADQSKTDKKNKKMGKNHRLMLQITENNHISTRKYMLDPSKGIYIGSKTGANHIVVGNASTVDDRQCEIVESGNKAYVHNLGISGRVLLSRGGNRAYVEQKYIELKSSDTLYIGESILEIEIIRAKEN